MNLNEDPLMSECLLYYIKDGVTRSEAAGHSKVFTELIIALTFVILN